MSNISNSAAMLLNVTQGGVTLFDAKGQLEEEQWPNVTDVTDVSKPVNERCVFGGELT
jgi:hypothetical protein